MDEMLITAPWSMKPRMCSDLAIDAMLMAVWRRKPQQQVMIHSDQGSQFSSSDWQSFLKANNVVSSMSRRGNCHDNAVAELFPAFEAGANPTKDLRNA